MTFGIDKTPQTNYLAWCLEEYVWSVCVQSYKGAESGPVKQWLWLYWSMIIASSSQCSGAEILLNCVPFKVYSSSIYVLFNLFSMIPLQKSNVFIEFEWVRHVRYCKGIVVSTPKLSGNYLLAARDRFIFDLTKVSLTELSEKSLSWKTAFCWQ